MRVEQGFVQAPYELGNPWTDDPAFQHLLLRLFSASPRTSATPSAAQIVSSLHSFGSLVHTHVRPLGEACDNPGGEPTLVQYDQWGRRVDKLITSEGWRGLKRLCAELGVVSEAYGVEAQAGGKHTDASGLGGRQALGDFARVFAFARLYLMHPDSQVVLCPMSMTDGAARVLELLGTPSQRETVLSRLLSRDPERAWTAGQWMTEKAGGSDVSMTETSATRVDKLAPGQKAKAGDKYILDGFKWFSSATDGDAALALARTDPDLSQGSRGLSLFLVRMRDEETGKLNGIRVHRLKKKLGTNLVPTAELELEGCVAELVGEEGRGVASIALVLNITRMYSAVSSVSALTRSLQIATAYAKVRRVGKPGVPAPGVLLRDLPLHTSMLAKVSVLHRALIQLVFSTCALLGASESGTATPAQQSQLRLLTPVAKAFTATRASEGFLKCIESLGGAGYMNENQLGRLLRDATVERIWEGTSTVLALDVSRVLAKDHGAALREFCAEKSASLDGVVSADLDVTTTPHVVRALRDALSAMQDIFVPMGKCADPRAPRVLLELLGIVHCGVALLEQASWARQRSPSGQNDGGDAQAEVEVARMWVLGDVGGLAAALSEARELADGGKRSADVEAGIVFGGEQDGKVNAKL